MKVRAPKLKVMLLLLIPLFGGMLYVLLFPPEKAGSFVEWYRADREATEPPSDSLHQAVITSDWLHVDGIQRSMQGPYNLTPVQLNERKSGLIWLVGYESSLLGEEKQEVPDGFMCHNNLNIVDKSSSPWQIKTHGSNIRLFTLTEGQTELHLPKGFGIPLWSSQELEVVSQVLNHNDPSADFQIQPQTTIYYQYETERSEPLTPLYQQAVFVTKQTDGPVGDFGSSLLCNAYEIDSTNKHGDAPQTSAGQEAPYNPYQDAQGRKYTGHWQLAPGRETLVTNVTKMLNLEFDTRIHYMAAHLHPFGESLTLVDATTGDTLQRIEAQNHDNKVGLREIGTYASTEGIPVYQNHEYELVSTYNCTDSVGKHTAMATLFLYLHDRE